MFHLINEYDLPIVPCMERDNENAEFRRVMLRRLSESGRLDSKWAIETIAALQQQLADLQRLPDLDAYSTKQPSSGMDDLVRHIKQEYTTMQQNTLRQLVDEGNTVTLQYSHRSFELGAGDLEIIRRLLLDELKLTEQNPVESLFCKLLDVSGFIVIDGEIYFSAG